MTVEVKIGLEGVAIAESAVSFVDGQNGRLAYRGISIEELAEQSSFEETSWLLTRGELPTRDELARFCRELTGAMALDDAIVSVLRCLPRKGHPMDALQSAVAAAGMIFPHRHNLSDEQKWQASVRLIAAVPAIVATFERMRAGEDYVPPKADLDLASNYLYMRSGSVPDAEQSRVLGMCLILHADHTQNASTFSGRVVGSTMASPFCVISSAVGALSGPLHGGANEDVMALLDRIGSVEKVKPTIETMIANKAKIPGFGHRVYKTMDPRAKVLKAHAESLAKRSGSRYYDVAREVEKIVIDAYGGKGIWPNVDFYSGIVYSELGIPRDIFTSIFAIARVSGWLAHWLEQLVNNRIYRPTQKYVGRHDVHYTPMNQR